jgi:hypothetical protein
MKKIFFGLILASVCIFANSQNRIDINAAETKNLRAQESADYQVRNFLIEADRYRTFDFNLQLANLQSENIGDTLLLNFFEDKQYKSVIKQVTKTINGRTSITSKIIDEEFAYCYMVVSEETVSISAEIPFADEYFFAAVKDMQSYLFEVKKSETDKKTIDNPDDVIHVPDYVRTSQNHQISDKGIDDDVTIDLLYVYTPAAKQWASNNSYYTDIYDIIEISLQRSNVVMENSGTGVTFKIVHTHLTDYIETNSTLDLYRITDPTDGLWMKYTY